MSSKWDSLRFQKKMDYYWIMPYIAELIQVQGNALYFVSLEKLNDTSLRMNCVN